MARKTKDAYIGEQYINKYGTALKIVQYRNYKDVDCLDVNNGVKINND